MHQEGLSNGILTFVIVFPKTRYFDVYNYSRESSTTYQRRILGDATGEFGPLKGGLSPQQKLGSNVVVLSVLDLE